MNWCSVDNFVNLRLRLQQVTKKTGIDGDDWKVIGAAIGVGVALIVIMIFTVYWQRR